MSKISPRFIRTLSRVLHVLAFVWFYFAGFMIILGALYIGFTNGVAAMFWVFNPYNILNFLETIAILSPGIALLWLSKWLVGEKLSA